ncbi:MAG TPA: LysM peptidoglycan-binding domain-containing protein, partial [Aggregatilineaceae bacterium]|nr:LysM peptidoglycan-binding domain-containing protein [Aggregatilineaceae bacterium]
MARAKRHRRYLHSLVVVGIVLSVVFALVLHSVPAAAQDGSTTYTVQAGENLFRIALRYGFTADYLAAVNGIADPRQIYAGQVLIIPGSSAPADPLPALANPAPAAPADLSAVPAVPVYHTVQRGETLASIARAYGVTWPDIAAANGLSNPNQIFGGQQLLIPSASGSTVAAAAPAPADPAPAAVEPAPAVSTGTERTHVVQAGEHLAAIARAYGIGWPTIARANNLSDANQIYAGQVLIIPATDDGVGGYSQPAAWAPPAPSPTITTGKQIVVDLSDQRVYAYENGQLIRNVLVSTGLWGTPTVTGDFQVYVKYDSQLMTGPGYYLPG